MELTPQALSMTPKPAADRPSELRQAAEAFEGAFLQILLKSMRATIPDGGLINRQQMQAYEEMQDRELADSLAGNGTLGIADTIVRHLGGDGAPVAPRSPRPVNTIHAMTAPSSVRAPSAATKPADPEGFVQNLWPAAKRVAAQLKVSASVLVAQAALETGWGQHVPKTADGGSSNNLFGIKAGNGWTGEKIWQQTTEYLGGRLLQVNAAFRAYGSVEDSLADYQALISQSSRYQGAMAAQSDSDYLKSIQAAGYATDPRYAEKIESIMANPAFQKHAVAADEALNQAGEH